MAPATRDLASDLRRLPAPKLEGGRSLHRALSERRSIRDYTDASLTLAALSQLL